MVKRCTKCSGELDPLDIWQHICLPNPMSNLGRDLAEAMKRQGDALWNAAQRDENLPAAAVPTTPPSMVQNAIDYHGTERLLAAMSFNDIVAFVEQHGRAVMTKQLFNDLMDELGEARRVRAKEKPVTPKASIDYSTWHNTDYD